MSLTPYAIASSTSAAASATLVLNVGTLSAGSGATGSGGGDAIVVGASVNSLGQTVTGVTDSQGNTYAEVPNPVTAVYNAAMFVALNCAPLTAGADTITVTFSGGSAQARNAGAIGCAGIVAAGAVDVNPAPVTNAGSTTPSIASGTLAQAAELLVSWADCANQVITWGGAFASAQLLGSVKTLSNQESAMAALPVSSTASVTASGTITSAKWAIQLVSLKAAPMVAVSTASLTQAAAGQPYSSALAASGGTAPLTWAVTAGSLPAGLTLSSAGVIAGTPAAAGVSAFTVRVTDAASATGTMALTLTVSGRNLLTPPAGFGLFGAYPGGGNAAPGPFEAANMASRQLAVFVRYETWDTAWPGTADKALMAAGRILSARWPYRTAASGVALWTDIAAGVWDTTIQAQANRLAALDVPVMVSPFGEFDGVPAMNAQGGTSVAPAAFVATWRRMWNIVAPIAPNVIWCWVPTGANNNAQTASMYPGDQYVDWIGFDEYDPSGAKGSPLATYQPYISWLAGPQMAGAGKGAGKPVGLFETGMDNPSAGGPSDAVEAAWIAKVPAALRQLGIQMWMWFNSSGTLGSTVITPGSLAASALASIGANSFFSPPSVLPSNAVPYLVGGSTAAGTASSTLVIPVTRTTGTGDAITVFADVNSLGVSVVSVADSRSNTYTQEETQAAAYPGGAFVALNTTALVADTDTITVTYSGSTAAAKNAAAGGCSGVLTSGAVDATPAPAASPGSTSPSVSTATLAQANEVVMAWCSSGSGGGQIQWAPGFTPLATGLQSLSNQISSLAAEVVAATAPVTAAGTITSAKWSMMAVSLKVGTSPAIVTASLPGCLTGAAYSQQLTVAGGLAPYAWSISAGSLPSGLSIGSSTGIISGTPAGPGTSSFTVQVTDSASSTASRVLSIVVSASVMSIGASLAVTAVLSGAVAGGAPAPTPLPPPIPLPPVPPVISSSAQWTFAVGPRQPAGGLTMALTDARSKTVTFRVAADQNHEASFVIDGRSPQAKSFQELISDLQVLRNGKILFAGRIVPTSDDLDGTRHDVTVTAQDYREVLRRRAFIPGDTLTFTNVEQATITWDMIQTAQGHSGGDLGIVRGLGASPGHPVLRSQSFALGDMIGDRISEMGLLASGFDWDVTPYGAADLRLDIWSPYRGFDRGVILEYGGPLVSTVTRSVDPSTYGNADFLTGQTAAGTALQAYIEAAGLAAAAEGRWDLTVGTTIQTLSVLQDKASWYLADGQVVVPAYTVTMPPGAWGGVDHIWLGDLVTIRIKSGRLMVNDQLRVMEIDVAVGDDGDERVTLSIGRIPPSLTKLASKMLRRLRDLELR